MKAGPVTLFACLAMEDVVEGPLEIKTVEGGHRRRLFPFTERPPAPC